jgi:hypothetical protein
MHRHLRRRAERAREIADAMRDAKAKELMLDVAKDYERAADLAETRLKKASATMPPGTPDDAAF